MAVTMGMASENAELFVLEGGGECANLLAFRAEQRCRGLLAQTSVSSTPHRRRTHCSLDLSSMTRRRALMRQVSRGRRKRGVVWHRAHWSSRLARLHHLSRLFRMVTKSVDRIAVTANAMLLEATYGLPMGYRAYHGPLDLPWAVGDAMGHRTCHGP